MGEDRTWGALDGMRAAAVAAVILFHLDPTRSPVLDPLRPSGGFVGVDVFFVLSGFLITSLLLRERDRTGRVALGGFYARRALRLFPALAAAMALALVVTAAAHHVAVTRAWWHPTLDGLPWVALYVGNWHIVRAGGEITNGALLHTWSLAIEEQFYLLFPVLLLGAVRLVRSRVALAAALAAAAGSVMAWRLVEGTRGLGLDRVYYATDTHSDGLLLGCAIGVALSSPALRRALDRPAARRAVRAGAWLGAAALLALYWRADQNATPGMELAISAAVVASAALVLAVAVDLPGPIARVLEWAPLRWVGRRSYGLYLYGFVLNVAVSAVVGPVASRRADAVAVAATVAVAAASYRWLEQPFLARKRRPVTAPAPGQPVPGVATA